jgi:hypothetical protein
MVEDKDRLRSHGTPTPANDNGRRPTGGEDPRILRIAEAIGRKLARDHIKRMQAANDNHTAGRDALVPSAMNGVRP